MDCEAIIMMHAQTAQPQREAPVAAPRLSMPAKARTGDSGRESGRGGGTPGDVGKGGEEGGLAGGQRGE